MESLSPLIILFYALPILIYMGAFLIIFFAVKKKKIQPTFGLFPVILGALAGIIFLLYKERFYFLEYLNFLKNRSWTAATVTLVWGPISSFLSSLLFALLGWSLAILGLLGIRPKVRQELARAKILTPIIVALLCLVGVGKMLFGEYRNRESKNNFNVAASLYTGPEQARAMAKKLLLRAANDRESESLLGVLAANPNLPSDILEELAKHVSPLVRYGVARNSATSATLLDKMVGAAKEETVRYAIASNPSASGNILEAMSISKEYLVRQAVAGNKNTPVKILERLSNDPEKYVRMALLRNPKCPIEIAKKLGADKEAKVRELSKKRQY